MDNLMTQDITHFKGRYLSLLERDDWEFASRSNASSVVVLVAVTPAAATWVIVRA